MGQSRGKFLDTDLSGVNYSAVAYHGNQFNSIDVDVRDAKVLAAFPQVVPNSTSGDQDVTFTYAFSPGDTKVQGGTQRIWTGTSNYPTSYALSVRGSGVGLSGAQIGAHYINVEPVQYVRLEGVYNNTTSTPVNFVNVYWSKMWGVNGR